jgi:membrane protease YdiL (CAAX protease family)
LLVALAVGVPAVWPQPAAGAVGQPSGPGAFVLPLLLFGAMLTVALACGHATGRGVRAAFGIERGARAAALRRGALGGLALVPPVLLMALAADGLLRGLGVPVEAQPALKLLADQTCPLPARLTLAALAVLVAPLAEEALFRGTLLPALLARSSTGTSLLLQATFFSAVHGHGASFLPLLVAGLGFGAGYVLTGSVATPVAMHAVFNAATMLLYLAA